MLKFIIKNLTPIAKYFFMGFLHEKNIQRKLDRDIEVKLNILKNTGMGKALGGASKIDDVPITNYEFYRKFYENPNEGDLMYPLSNYFSTKTSGTMGRPKKFLLAKNAIQENMRTTGFAMAIIATHDGDRFTFDFGDVVYVNAPGDNHVSSHSVREGSKYFNYFVQMTPDPKLTFKEKVDYFVKHYKQIDIAHMTVATLLDTIYPRIGEPFPLKGFMTMDGSAEALKESIKKVVGVYPSSVYGSTEALQASLPSKQYPGCFFFDWRILYPEFIPEKEQVSFDEPIVTEPPETVKLTEVEPGKRYQLVVSPFKTDITRFAMPDIMECVSMGDDVLGCGSPVFRYYARADKLIVLKNFTRINEKEIFHILNETGLSFVDFIAKTTPEGTKDYMTLYLELSENVDEKEVYQKIHDRFMDYDKDWRDLNNYFGYEPLRLKILPEGTFRRYLESKEGMPRIDRIEMRDETLQNEILNQKID